jgi:acyl-CoA dehydrogenase
MMVDFSLTEADVRLMDLTRREHESARSIAREIDRRPEHDPLPNEDHPAVADTMAPFDALRSEKEPISGLFITECLMAMVSSNEFGARRFREYFGTWIVKQFGSPEQIEAYGECGLVIGITEPGAGADPASMTSSARYDPATDEYVLNGEKTFISNIDREEGVLVMAKGEPDENGKRPFLNFVVLKNTPGFVLTSPIRKMGIHSHNLGGFVMQDVRVPALAKIKSGFANVQTRFNHNRPVVGANGLGICRSILDFTYEKLAEAGFEVNYANGRSARSFIQDKLIRMEALWEAGWGIVMRVKWLEEQLGETSLDYITEAAMAKTIGGKATREITQGCLELLGAEGLSEEYLAEKWFRDARIIDIYEGPGEVHRLTIARKLLGYRKGELD